MTELPAVQIATDGACKGNPGPGGWGALIRSGTREKELSGGEPVTTNNRMELMAAIQALTALTRPCHVTLSTDSRYVMDGLTKWIAGWQRNGWRTADKKPVKNVELWQALIAAAKPHRIDWKWVKGHAGHPDNERVDKLASDAAKAAGAAGRRRSNPRGRRETRRLRGKESPVAPVHRLRAGEHQYGMVPRERLFTGLSRFRYRSVVTVEPRAGDIMMLDRRDFLASAGGAVAAAYAPAISDDGTRPGREVLAFYYGWYANLQVSGTVHHWQGPGAANAAPRVDTPTLGLYDSHDPALIARHGDMLKQAGVTGIISSWWGQGSFEDKSLELLLPAMAERGLKVCAYAETGAHGRDGATSDLAYLVRRYGDQPAWLRVGDRPVVFVYGAAIKALPAPEWAAAADAVAAQGLPKPVLVGDVNPQDGFFATRAPAFEGLHTYVLAPYVQGLTPKQIAAYTDARYPKWKARVGSEIYCATVIPGFDDRKVPGRPLPRPTVARQGTGTFDALWAAAIKTKADWVLVTSFNEWHEDSEIEPSREYGDLFIRRNKHWADIFLAGA